MIAGPLIVLAICIAVGLYAIYTAPGKGGPK